MSKRLIELPCEIGDIVYTNVSMSGWYHRKKDKPYSAKVVFIGINGKDNFMNVELEEGKMLQFNFSQIGSDVFLTKEDDEEYTEPEVDWSKVPVDTKIYVSDTVYDDWAPRHFAKYVDDYVYAWDGGCTSFTTKESSAYEYAKLAEEE